MGTPTVLFIFTAPSTQFKALTGSSAGSGFCTPDMALIDNGGNDVVISGTANGSGFNYGGTTYTTYPAASATLTVQKNKQPKFSFIVCDINASTTTYALGGVALKNMGAGGGPGGGAFPSLSVDVANSGMTTLKIQDQNNGPANSTSSYDFWVMVQNSAGDVGLIDPLIMNES
jgi:hypothetical protein